MRFMVTDLTRFATEACHCVAGIGEDGRCYRPVREFFTPWECRAYSILPGVLLDVTFRYMQEARAPHIEDCHREGVRFLRKGRVREFARTLAGSCAPSVAEGFGVDLASCKRCIPVEKAPRSSIITVAIPLGSCFFHRDEGSGKIRFTFFDGAGEHYPNMPLADLKLRELLETAPDSRAIDRLNSFLQRQETVYLRLGIGRLFQSDERKGYWLQVNGVYTFPDWIRGTRALQR